ncbi:MAG: phosphoglucosamine mutase, partial [Vicinamibacteria bacterium]
GEGNGGVAVPAVHATHDSAAAIGLLLGHLAGQKRALSELVADLPTLSMRKIAIPVPPSLIYSALAEFRDAVGDVEGVTVDHTDGVKLVWPDGWVHVRASNTQSLVRIIAEAEGAPRAQELLDWARERLKA